MLTEPAAARTSGTVLRGFQDGLGRRYSPAARGENDAPLEILCFRHEITDVPSFDFALRERVARLSDFRHPYYSRIRKVDRLNDDRGTVALMSDGAPGDRLIGILADIERGGPVLDLNAALYLVRQLVSAIEVLHKHARVAHGAIAPERLFVTPLGRLCIVEYVMGAALEQLKYSRERYWKELRVALPMDVGLPKFDERADLTQVGTVALALVLGRPLEDSDYPGQIEELVESACARTAEGATEPLPSGLREWLRRALQLDVRSSFRSMFDAQAAFDELLSEDGTFSADARSLETFLERYHNPSSKPATPPAKPVLAPPVMPVTPAYVEPIAIPEAAEELVPPAAEIDPPVVPVAEIRAPAAEVRAPWEDFRPTSEPRDMASVLREASDDEQGETDDEEQQPMTLAHRGKRAFGRFKWIAAGLALAIATTGGLYAARQRFLPTGPPVTTGTMTVSTNPPGAEVEVDGATRGQTPVSLSLTAGAHTLVVRANGESRTIPINIAAGAQVSQYLEMPRAVSAVGQLNVRTEPSGARISVDGVPRGRTPVILADLSPGEHAVMLEGDLGSVTQNVTIEAGVTSSLVVPLTAAPGAVLSGWVSVTAPVVVDLYEQGRLLGTSGIDRIMLPTGRHEIELVNEPLAYRETRTVQVAPGRVSAINVALPKGAVSINAVPWASVSIDGESIGDTPIGNLPIAIGPHEVVFRNTELGEQRRVITVTLRSPVRLSVDMTRK